MYYNKKHTERLNNYETNLRGKFTTLGKVWVNNGSTRKYINKDEELPSGYKYGFKLNHKVVGIRIIHECTPVYDLTIEDTHNFALDAGVFVHNSDKGVTDAVIASAHSALIEQDIMSVLRSRDTESFFTYL